MEIAFRQLNFNLSFTQVGLSLNIKSLAKLEGKEGYYFNETTDEDKREQKT
jgi:hypothetical protein